MVKRKRNGLTSTECSVKICRFLPLSSPYWKWSYHNATQSECARRLGSCVFVGNLIQNFTLHLRVTIYTKKLRASDCQITSPFFHVTRVQFCCLWNINSCLLTPNWVVMVGGIACNQSESSILIAWYKWTNQKAGFSHSILMTSQEPRAIGN